MSQWKVGVVTSRFNEEVTGLLEEGAINYLEDCGVEILAVRVPGAVEIPLACKALFERGCDGVVACGTVIRGETSHYDVVCNSVERGVTQLMLEIGKPVGFGVITVENEEQAMARAGGEHGNKGAEAAQVVIEMIGLLQHLRDLEPPKVEKTETVVKAKAKAKPKAKAKAPAKKTATKVRRKK